MKLSSEKRSGRAAKGSQFHLQNLVNQNPALLNTTVMEESQTLKNAVSEPIKWVSPLKQENYIEYQDDSFLEAIGYQNLAITLTQFWPVGGPVWDAIGTVKLKTNNKHGVILLEAKSHIGEMKGSGSGAKGRSREQIVQTLDEVGNAMGVNGQDWINSPYYQYANRLAHLYYLLIKQKIPTWLVFLYFIGDKEQGGPSSREKWLIAIESVKNNDLGLPPQHILSDNIINVFYHPG